MTKIIVEVSGGVVQQVYSTSSDVRIVKIDWDAGESPGDAFTGGPMFVQQFSELSAESRFAFEILDR